MSLVVQPRPPLSLDHWRQEALSEALTRLAGDPALRSRLGDAGLVSAQRFSPQATAEVLLDVYRSMLVA